MLWLKLTMLVCMLSFQVYGQTTVQYENRVLKKVLKKEGISDFADISEIIISDSIVQHKHIHGKFFEISSANGPYKYMYTGRVNSCRAGGCSIADEEPKDAALEYFDYFILFDENKTVQLVKVFNYQATHGYEITAKGWLKQFIGYEYTDSLQVSKNIDAISGATISVYAIVTDIETKTKLLQSIY